LLSHLLRLPVICITSPSNGATVSHGHVVVVKGTASDDPGGSSVKTAAVEVDSGSFVMPRLLLQEIGPHGLFQFLFQQDLRR
jgi:Bacterial Ig domain